MFSLYVANKVRLLENQRSDENLHDVPITALNFLAVEPVPQNCSLLLRNMQRHKLLGCVYNVALGDSGSGDDPRAVDVLGSSAVAWLSSLGIFKFRCKEYANDSFGQQPFSCSLSVGSSALTEINHTNSKVCAVFLIYPISDCDSFKPTVFTTSIFLGGAILSAYSRKLVQLQEHSYERGLASSYLK
jgi:hypothetical protein